FFQATAPPPVQHCGGILRHEDPHKLRRLWLSSCDEYGNLGHPLTQVMTHIWRQYLIISFKCSMICRTAPATDTASSTSSHTQLIKDSELKLNCFATFNILHLTRIHE
ncbi:unnamed protein product, partial [Cyprideis torosa]